MNHLFPLNPLIIIVAAYVLRCLARIFAQTFKAEDYDWRGGAQALVTKTGSQTASTAPAQLI